MERKPKIQFYVGDFAGCAHYRIMIPMLGLQKTNKYECAVSYVINENKFSWEPDVVVFSRQHKGDVMRQMERYKSIGAKLVYDTDDNLLNVHPSNPAFKALQTLRKDIISSMRMCDLITVSTKPLVDVYKKVNPNIKVLPNQILPIYAKMKPKNRTDQVRIGWAGTNTHVGDFSVAAHDLVTVAKKYDHVKLVFFGWVPDMIREAFSDDRGQLLEEKIEFHEFIDVSKYHMKLGLLSLDIGIAPLQQTPFNVAKSNLKILEYGVMATPTVASPVYPYENTLKDGYDGILVKKNKKWARSLSTLIEDEKLRTVMGKRIQHKIISQYNIEDNIGKWEEAYLDGVTIK